MPDENLDPLNAANAGRTVPPVPVFVGVPPAAEMKEKRPHTNFGGFLGCFTVVGIIATVLFALILTLTVLLFSSCSDLFKDLENKEKDPAERIRKTFYGGNRDAEAEIAVIRVSGTIVSDAPKGLMASAGETTSAQTLCLLIRTADADPDVKAILIELDTPGGEAAASDEIYHALKQCRKPVVAYLNSMAASGGYYIACGAQKIVANELTLTGSIGVIMQSYNFYELLDFIGVEAHVYTSGKMKSMLNGALPHDKKADPVIQSLVDNTYRRFASIVSEARGIPLETITGGEIGDGRIFDGRQALALRLVDRLGYFDDAVDFTADLSGLGGRRYKVFQWNVGQNFEDLLSSCASAVSPGSVKLALPGVPSTKNQLKKHCLYFLPSEN